MQAIAQSQALEVMMHPFIWAVAFKHTGYNFYL